MATWRHPRWHNILLIVLLAGIAAAFAFGLDVTLNAVSMIVTVSIAVAVLGLIVLGVCALAWITIGDAIEETRFDRRSNIAWRWRFIAYAGVIGILVDGVVGAWHAYQYHIVFSAAVESIPFAGVPVLVTLASYPIKWIEQFLMRRQ